MVVKQTKEMGHKRKIENPRTKNGTRLFAPDFMSGIKSKKGKEKTKQKTLHLKKLLCF